MLQRLLFLSWAGRIYKLTSKQAGRQAQLVIDTFQHAQCLCTVRIDLLIPRSFATATTTTTTTTHCLAFPFHQQSHKGVGSVTFAPRFQAWKSHPPGANRPEASHVPCILDNIRKGHLKKIPAYNLGSSAVKGLPEWSQKFLQDSAKIGATFAPCLKGGGNWHIDGWDCNSIVRWSPPRLYACLLHGCRLHGCRLHGCRLHGCRLHGCDCCRTVTLLSTTD